MKYRCPVCKNEEDVTKYAEKRWNKMLGGEFSPRMKSTKIYGKYKFMDCLPEIGFDFISVPSQ